ncbi:MAG TPA: hypothetical protein VF346_06625 [Bacteroidales bacterium]
MKKNQNSPPPYQGGGVEKDDVQEYKLYPENEDIYKKYKEEEELDPEDISKVKKLSWDDEAFSDVDSEFNEAVPGSDLDIPGSELDDEPEMMGSEDEENNYYSLGGDGHNNLDEDKDEL